MNNFLVAPWNTSKKVKTLITTRLDGYSAGKYHSLNLGLNTNDNTETIIKNRKLLRKYLPSDPFWLTQTHSNKVVNLNHISSNLNQPLEYDASFTTSTNKICAVLTADCLPILITNSDTSSIGAIHAGWRGLENGIIQNTINHCNLNPKELLVYIGPSICNNHFEVGQEVFDQFIRLNAENHLFFYPNENGKYNCDLSAIANNQLLNLGVSKKNIYLSNICTYCQNHLFYSYRKNPDTGRFASLIWLEP